MEMIVKANQTVLSILRKPKQSDDDYRLMHYCVTEQVENGVLIHNLLTREMVLLSTEEYRNMEQIPVLRERWFLVPAQTRDQEYADLVKWVLKNTQKKRKNITGYTIFTTTDCNARCFYCFEAGRSRIPMSRETALKTVQYIKAHCGGEKVHICWMGGEPLFNMEVIDIICDGLRAEGVEFRSSMISNGYLFSDEVVRTAVHSWNLERIQITLDGTERIYIKAKAYIYEQGSAYRIVLDNIGKLLDAGVRVDIRMNLDLYNAANLVELAEELKSRFAGKKGLRAYAHHLYESGKAMAESHTEEGWNKRDQAMAQLYEKLESAGLAGKAGLPKNPKLNYCMVDSGTAVTILPEGQIGLCDQCSDSGFIGHIDREGFDEAAVTAWRETVAPIPECKTCFYYPQCVMLKRCANANVCFEQRRNELLRKTKRQMRNEYDRWKVKSQAEDPEEPDHC